VEYPIPLPLTHLTPHHIRLPEEPFALDTFSRYIENSGGAKRKQSEGRSAMSGYELQMSVSALKWRRIGTCKYSLISALTVSAYTYMRESTVPATSKRRV